MKLPWQMSWRLGTQGFENRAYLGAPEHRAFQINPHSITMVLPIIAGLQNVSDRCVWTLYDFYVVFQTLINMGSKDLRKWDIF